MAIHCGFLVPFNCLVCIILIYIINRKIGAGRCIAFLGCFFRPFKRLNLILICPDACKQHIAYLHHGFTIVKICRLLVPLKSLFIVPYNTPAYIIIIWFLSLLSYAIVPFFNFHPIKFLLHGSRVFIAKIIHTPYFVNQFGIILYEGIFLFVFKRFFCIFNTNSTYFGVKIDKSPHGCSTTFIYRFFIPTFCYFIFIEILLVKRWPIICHHHHGCCISFLGSLKAPLESFLVVFLFNTNPISVAKSHINHCRNITFICERLRIFEETLLGSINNNPE